MDETLRCRLQEILRGERDGNHGEARPIFRRAAAALESARKQLSDDELLFEDARQAYTLGPEWRHLGLSD